MPALYNNQLTTKQRVFVEEYLKTGNATQSAIKAGYPERSAYSVGNENLRKPYIKAKIETRLLEIEKSTKNNLSKLKQKFQEKFNRKNCDTHRGFIYVLRADNGLIKIGRTVDIARRLRFFNTQLPYDLQIIKIVESDNCHALENELHIRFSAKRVRGEWFKLSEKDLEMFYE